MAGVVEIMDEMAQTLSDVLGDDIQVVGRMNFNPTPTSIDIYPAPQFRGEDAAAFGDVSGELVFIVRARATTADNEAGQDELLQLMDDESPLCVAAALMEDQTLNGKVAAVDVTGPTGFAEYADSGNNGFLLGCEWTATVVNKGS